jgi:choline dehydrogenase-like flavoprotein
LKSSNHTRSQFRRLSSHLLRTASSAQRGCRIGANNNEGVVDELGRVYDRNKGAGSTEVIKNLFIVDGSVIPGALAANPTMTITAQAVKSVNAALP